MKTGIIIITFNIDSRIFILQVNAIRNFCKDDFTIEIIDNSSDEEIAEAMKYHASVLRINYTRTHADTKDSSHSHSFAANLSYQLLKDKYEVLFYLDHDCIPVEDFSCVEILGDNFCGGVGQEKAKRYLWPGCFMFKNNLIDHDLIDFSTNQEFQLDTGGNLFNLVEVYKDKCFFFNEVYQQIHDYNGKLNYFSIVQHTFWHFIGGSNWFGIEDSHNRINAFLNMINKQIDG